MARMADVLDSPRTRLHLRRNSSSMSCTARPKIRRSAQLFAGMSKLNKIRPTYINTDASRIKQERTGEDIQQCDDIAL